MKIGTFLLNLLYPRRAVCVGCGSQLGCDLDDLCEDCRAKLAAGWIGVRTLNDLREIDGAAFAYRYHGPAGSMVRELKYGGVKVLSEKMSRDLARAAETLHAEIDVVTAVPMPPKRLRMREWNQAEVLARGAAESMELPYENLLRRTKDAPQQARLSHEERKKNLRDGFAAEGSLSGQRVLLIDDVLTTGATAKACAKALRDAGAEKVYFAAFALGRKDKKKHG